MAHRRELWRVQYRGHTMKKPRRVSPRLVVRRETIRELERQQLERVVGGDTNNASCTTGLQQPKPPG